MHLLLVGNQESPRSELLWRLLQEGTGGRPVCGYQTVKEAPDKSGAQPVYLYPIGQERVKSRENLVGTCKNRCAVRFPETFDRYAYLIADAPKDAAMVLDGLGVMESGAESFCRAVLRRLDGDAPVLAAVRDIDTPFLNAVRAHPKARCFFLCPGTEEQTYRQALAFWKAQL